MVAAGLKQVVGFALTPGQAHDAPAGRELISSLGVDNIQVPLLMDRAYEGNETRILAQALGLDPVVPPKQNRLDPWEYDTELYKRRNEIERLFGRIKRFRRIFTRYEKTDLMFCAFITITLIADMLR
jgi:transposase